MMERFGSCWNNYGSVEQAPLSSVVKRVLGPRVLQEKILIEHISREIRIAQFPKNRTKK